MTTTTQQTTITELRKNLVAAQAHQRELALESEALPIQLRNASRRVAREKAAAARSGDTATLTTTAADLDAQELRDREAALPFDLWAQRLVVAEIHRDLHRAKLEAAEVERKRTAPEYEAAQRDLALAEKRLADAYAAHSSAGNRANIARTKLRDANKAISDLEESHPVT